VLEICKWKNNAAAPVLLMVDDLANVWVDSDGNGRVDPGEDWGYAKDGPNSSFRYLNERILGDFPQVKTTFFTPVGVRAGLVPDGPIPSVARPIDADPESRAFFRMIHAQPRFEIAYHGTTHGRTGASAREFQQEWLSYPSLAAAKAAIARGKEIYREVFGEYPSGGKYCGYLSNQFSDASIEQSGFLWWCRYWNRGLFAERHCRTGGSDTNPLTAFDLKYFPNQTVLDIPSTLDGGLFTDVTGPAERSWKSRLKRALRNQLISKRLESVAYLVGHRLVVSIQEHIAPARDDGQRQRPNLFDDTESLWLIFAYLQTQNVWYCTGTELAEYAWLRDHVTVAWTGPRAFRLGLRSGRPLRCPEITVKLTGPPCQALITPDGQKAHWRDGVVTIPVQDGEYQLV
jgi:hypothetical protein